MLLTVLATFAQPVTAFADMGFKPGSFGNFVDTVSLTWPYALLSLLVSAASLWALRRMARGAHRSGGNRGADD
jgi:hypothetical protein